MALEITWTTAIVNEITVTVPLSGRLCMDVWILDVWILREKMLSLLPIMKPAMYLSTVYTVHIYIYIYI